MTLEWKHEYETGSSRIDDEHRVFLDLVREFVEECEDGAEHTLLLRLAHEIYKYADFHFFSEERMMTRIRYADLAHHHQVHQQLLEELRLFVESLATDSSQAPTMARFLVRWFVSHTVTEDTKLAGAVAAFDATRKK